MVLILSSRSHIKPYQGHPAHAGIILGSARKTAAEKATDKVAKPLAALFILVLNESTIPSSYFPVDSSSPAPPNSSETDGLSGGRERGARKARIMLNPYVRCPLRHSLFLCITALKYIGRCENLTPLTLTTSLKQRKGPQLWLWLQLLPTSLQMSWTWEWRCRYRGSLFTWSSSTSTAFAFKVRSGLYFVFSASRSKKWLYQFRALSTSLGLSAAAMYSPRPPIWTTGSTASSSSFPTFHGYFHCRNLGRHVPFLRWITQLCCWTSSIAVTEPPLRSIWSRY